MATKCAPLLHLSPPLARLMDEGGRGRALATWSILFFSLAWPFLMHATFFCCKTRHTSYRCRMAPKSIWRQPNAVHFQVVHRSQRDVMRNDPDVGQHVLKPYEPLNRSKVCIRRWRVTRHMPWESALTTVGKITSRTSARRPCT